MISLPANWRTSLYGTLTAVFLYLRDNPQDVAAVLDPASAKRLAGYVALATGILTALHMKDRQVSGNGSADDPTRVPDQTTGGSRILPLLFCLLLPASCLLSGCYSLAPAYLRFAASTERTYTLRASDTSEGDRSIETSITLRPVRGFAK